MANKVSSYSEIKEREYKHFLEGFSKNIASELGGSVLRSAALLNCFYIKKSKFKEGEKFHHIRSEEFIINNDQLNEYLNNRKYNYGDSLFLKHFKSDYTTRTAVREGIISLKSDSYKLMPLEMFLDTKGSYAKNLLIDLFGEKKEIDRIGVLSTQSFIEKTFNRYSKKTKDLETLLLYLAANGIVVGKSKEDKYYLFHKENENILMHFGGEALRKWSKKLDKCKLEEVYEKLDPLVNRVNKSDVRYLLSGNYELPGEEIIKELGLEYAINQVRKELQDKGEMLDQEKEFRKDKAEFEKEFKEGVGQHYGTGHQVGEESGLGSNPFEYFDSDESSYNSNERELKRKKKKKKNR